MKIVKIVKSLAVLAVLPAVLTMPAPAATHRYVIELSTEPAARFASRNFGERKESLARPEVQTHTAVIRREQDAVAAQVRRLGGTVVERTGITSNTLIVDLPEEKAAGLSSITGVKAFHKTRLYGKTLDQAGIVHKLPQVYSQIGGASNAGAGIKIGMIDTGIDVTQPAFQDTGFQVPAGYPKVNNTLDTKFTNNRVIGARSYVSLLDKVDPDIGASDESGHGTSTASCAAGGTTVSSVSTFTGIAPGAYLAAYKVFGTPGYNDYANDAAILKAIDDAVADGMDVINFSLGGFPPVPAAQDSIATALNNAVSAGVIVAAAAGNDGNDLYYNSTGLAPTVPAIVSTDGAQNVISVGASSNQRSFGPQLTVGSASFLADAEDTISTDAKNNPLVLSGAPIVDVASVDTTGRACTALTAGSLTGAIALISIGGWDPNTDDCSPYIKMTNAQNAGAIGAVIFDTYPEDLDFFYEYSYYYSYSYFGYAGIPSVFVTLDDGKALKALLANQAAATATLDLNFNPVPVNPDRVWFQSSRGPSADFEIKPDLVAVGQYLLTATESINPGGEFYSSSGLQANLEGTSGASPLVAGAAAVLKAARPGLTALQYRSLLINSTAPISGWAGGLARVMDAGSGLMDVNAALNAEATIIPASLSFGIGDGTAALTKSIVITNAGAAADTFNLTVAPRDPGFAPQIDQTTIQLDPGASATVQVSIPAGVLSAGEYEGAIHVKGNNTATDTHVAYWFGVPSTTPFLIADMGSDYQDYRGLPAKAAIVFRVTDASGIYMTNILDKVEVTVTQGGGTVDKVYELDPSSLNYSPGVIAVDVTMDRRPSYDNYFHVQIGNLGLDFVITGVRLP